MLAICSSNDESLYIKKTGEMCWLFALAMLNHDIFRPWRVVLAICSSNDESWYIKTPLGVVLAICSSNDESWHIKTPEK